MDPQAINQNMIPQPELWRCAMEINAGSIEVALFPPVATERVIHTTIQLNPEAPYHEKSVQEAFYANPFLLSDFKAVDVLFGCDSAMFVPSAVTAQAGVEAVYSAGGGETGGKKILDCALPGDMVLVYAVDAWLYGFVRRTFFNVRVAHRLAPLVSRALNTPAVLAVVESGRLDIVATAESRLFLARSLCYRTPQDATYYIIAARKSLGLPADVPLSLAGAGDDAQTVAGYLSRYCETPQQVAPPQIAAVLDKDSAAMPQSLLALLS